MTRVVTSLDLRYIDGDRWLLLNRFRFYSVTLGCLVDIEAGLIFDFNSTPRISWNILPPTEYGEASVPHDHFYKTGKCNGKPITRAQADAVHGELVRWVGGPSDPDKDRAPAPRWKRVAFAKGLQLFGWITWRRYRRADLEAAA